MARNGATSISTDIPDDLLDQWNDVCDKNRYRKNRLFIRLMKTFLSWPPDEQEAFHESPEAELSLLGLTEDRCREIVQEVVEARMGPVVEHEGPQRKLGHQAHLGIPDALDPTPDPDENEDRKAGKKIVDKAVAREASSRKKERKPPGDVD